MKQLDEIKHGKFVAYLLLPTALRPQQTLLIDLSILPHQAQPHWVYSTEGSRPPQSIRGNSNLLTISGLQFPGMLNLKALIKNISLEKTQAHHYFTLSLSTILWLAEGCDRSWDTGKRCGPLTPLLLLLKGIMIWVGRKEIQRKDKPQCNSKGPVSDCG